VIGIEERPEGVLVRTRSQELLAPVVVNCAGLHSDRVAALAGSRPLDDFAFAETARVVHVINAPSPAATAALSIGQFIAGKVAERTGPPAPP
jgi:L-2-hydroxyglutarate oxidase LhgO